MKKDTEVYKNNDLAYFIFLLNTDEEIALAKLFNSKEINYRFLTLQVKVVIYGERRTNI